MRIELQVPYRDKDRAKSLGARWDLVQRIWYVNNPEDLSKFKEWMSTDVNQFYKNKKIK